MVAAYLDAIETINVLLEGSKITKQIGPAKLVVKRRATQRAINHNIQCTDYA